MKQAANASVEMASPGMMGGTAVFTGTRVPVQSFRRHLPRFSIAVILRHCMSNRVEDSLAVLPNLLAAIPTASAGRAGRVAV